MWTDGEETSGYDVCTLVLTGYLELSVVAASFHNSSVVPVSDPNSTQ